MIAKEGVRSERTALPRMHVVVCVDDQPEVLSSLRRVLTREPYEVWTTLSPQEALDWLEAMEVDILIADERMPAMRGTDLLEEVQKRSPRTRRVVLTGYPGSSTIDHGLTGSVQCLISKPWNDDALKMTIRGLLKSCDLSWAPLSGSRGEKPETPPAPPGAWSRPPEARGEEPARDPGPVGLPLSREELESNVRESVRELRTLHEDLLREIAERQRIQESLRFSEERFRYLVEEVGDYAILTLSSDGHVVSWNRGAQRLHGYLSEEILGRHFSCFYPREEAGPGTLERLLQAARQAGRLEIEGWRLRKDGSRFWASSVLLAVRGSGGELRGFSNVVRDLTERRKVDEERSRVNAQMLQGQKMQAIGELTAGIAHEINNPVGFILSNLTTLGEYRRDFERLLQAAQEVMDRLRQKEDPSPALAAFDRLREELNADFILRDFGQAIQESTLGAERIRDIVKSLREFSHVDEGDLKPTDVNKCLEDALRICWNEVKYHAEVRKDYGELPPIPAYPQRLEQVFVNLIVNAAQAIPKKGRIDLVTRVENGLAVVRIRDTGGGIAPENLPRIFQPFFTTKPVGSGIGLGLHMAYKVVAAHDGTIDVHSEVGRGTEFAIRLPVAGPRPSITSRVPAPLSGRPPPAGS
jgi:PAS domain S-box-containing protein